MAVKKDKTNDCCPNCGYCPHCGQSTRPPIIPAPYPVPMPYRPWPRPYYGHPEVTWTGKGNTSEAPMALQTASYSYTGSEARC